MSAERWREQVRLRVFQMPCCGQQLCWVNPRLPNHCPECGSRVYAKLHTGEHTLLSHVAWLSVGDHNHEVEAKP